MKKNVLITGTSTGVGYESAILFAQNGYKVYASMRNTSKADRLRQNILDNNLDIEIIILDVTDISTIKEAIDNIIKKDGKIDVLINNAGAGFVKTTEQASEEEIREFVASEVAKLEEKSMKQMGVIMGASKAKFGNSADGALLSKIVKEELSK